MTTFPVHSSETAPEGSAPYLAAAQNKFGFVPNFIRVLAEAPDAAEAYMTVMDIFESSSLSDAEKQTVLLSASFVNECDYCMAAHTKVAAMKGVPTEIIDALRSGTTLPDPNSPLKKASLTGFHATAKHIAAKAISPSSETMRTI